MRALIFELPRSRLRMAVVSRSFSQIVEDMDAFRFDRLAPMIEPDAVVQWFDLGTFRGPDGWEAGLRQWREGWEESALGMREYIDLGTGQVLCVGFLRGRGRASGAEVTHDLWFLIRIRHGMAVSGRFIADKGEAFAAMGWAA